MALEPLTEEAVTQLLQGLFCVMLVTKEEHSRLNANGVRYTMPKEWNGQDLYARYRMWGIEPVLEEEAASEPARPNPSIERTS